MRLIDADETKKLNKEQCVGDCGCCSDLQDDNTCALIDRVPAVDDAVIVTRCKDCKYYRNHPNGLCYLHTEPTENERGYSGEAVCVEPDDFCSYGERRGE